MIYNLISADIIISRLANDHNVSVVGNLPRMPTWIYQALDELKLLRSWIPVAYHTTVRNRFATLPSEAKYIIGVEYNNSPCVRQNYPINKSTQSLPTPTVYDTSGGVTIRGTLESIEYDEETNELTTNVTYPRRYNYMTIQNASSNSRYTYILVHNKLEFTFDTGDIWIYYYKFPIEYSESFACKAPLVPDNENVLEYITYSIIKHMLQRGYKHPVYNLADSNPFTNVGLIVNKLRPIALNDVNDWDKETSDNIVKTWNTSLLTYLSGGR